MNLSIKNVPEDLVERLRARAGANHRSLQGELLSIVESALRETGPLSFNEISQRVVRLGLTTPSESVRIIRQDRDAH